MPAETAQGNGRPLSPEVTERLLRLAAYVKRRGEEGTTVTLERLTEELPDYASAAERNPDGSLVVEGKGYEGLRKKVRRDLGDLEASFGIGVDYEEGSGEYRLRPPFLTTRQRRALFAAAATVHVDDDIELRPGDLAAGVDDATAPVLLHLHRAVGDLRTAIAGRQSVAFIHAGRRRVVDPYALGHWRRYWYLVGHDRGHDEVRRFRLDRIETDGDTSGIEPLGQPGCYEIPEEFDSAKALDLHPDAWGREIGRAHV